MTNAKIISVSRRTDIPAFFGEWFMNGIKRGYVDSINPFNRKYDSRISLLPEDVIGFVFWTKNAKPFMKYLNSLDEKGFNYYFQYTLTSYDNRLEKNVPRKSDFLINNFIDLSKKIGKEKVIWRYDPILLSDQYTKEYHYMYFDKLANILSSYTNKVIFSFVDDYRKTKRKFSHLNVKEITENDMLEMTKMLKEIADRYNLKIETCSEEIELKNLGVAHGKCIDDQFFKPKSILKKDKGQRKECGCVESIDVGANSTCSHHCIYCYANISEKAVNNNLKKHDPNSSLLIGDLKGNEDIHWRNGKNSLNLKEKIKKI